MVAAYEELKLTVSFTDQASEGLQALSVKMKSLGANLGVEQERLIAQLAAFKEKIAPFDRSQKEFGAEADQSAAAAKLLAMQVSAGLTIFGGLAGAALGGVAALRTFSQTMAGLQGLSRELGTAPEQLKALMNAFQVQGITGPQAEGILRSVQRSMVQVLDNTSPLITNLREHSKHSVAAAVSIERYITKLREHAARGDMIGFWNEQTKAMQEMPKVLEAAGFTPQQTAEFTNAFLAVQNLGPEVRKKWEEVKPLSDQAIAAMKVVNEGTKKFNAAWNWISVARAKFFDAIIAIPFGPDSLLVKGAEALAVGMEEMANRAERLRDAAWGKTPAQKAQMDRFREALEKRRKPGATPPAQPQQFSGASGFNMNSTGVETAEFIQQNIRINPENWDKFVNDPELQKKGWAQIEDRRGQSMPLPPKTGTAGGGGGGPQTFNGESAQRKELVDELKRLNQILLPTTQPEGVVGFGGGTGLGGLGGGGAGLGGGMGRLRGMGGGPPGQGPGGGGGPGTYPGTGSTGTPGTRGSSGGPGGRPGAEEPEGGKGATSKADVRSMLEKHVEEAGLVGYVPKDGDQYGIKTGSKEEWVHFFTELAGKETSYNGGPKSDNWKDPGGSHGLLQVSALDNKRHNLGLPSGNTPQELHDPNTGLRVGVHLGAKWIKEGGTIGNMRKSWSPFRSGWRPAAPGSKGVQADPGASGGGGGAGAPPPGQTGFGPGIRDISTTAGTKLARDGVMVPEGLLVHHTNSRGSAEDLVSGLRSRKTNDKLGLSVQFAIERDGSIVALMPDGSIARHAGDLEKSTRIAGRKLGNWNLEGVEVIALNEDDVTEEQKASIGKLYRARQARWGWKGPENSLYGHGELTGRKEDIEGRTATEYRTGKRQLPPELQRTAGTSQTPAQQGPIGAEPGSANRPGYYGGTITVGGQTFNYGTGGGGRGSTPYGTYPVNIRNDIGVGGTGQLGDVGRRIGSIATVGGRGGEIDDPAYPGRPREGIQIHPASHDQLDRLYTAGCFGIAKSQWPRFKEALLKEATKGPLFLTINRNGQATIGGKQIVPGDGRQVIAEEKGAASQGTAAPSNKGMTKAEATAYTRKLNAMTPAERDAEYKRRDAGLPPSGGSDRSVIDKANADAPKGNVQVKVRVNAAPGTVVKASSTGPLITKTTTERTMAPADAGEE